MQWRHGLHAHPELAFEEHTTAAFVSSLLSSWGLQLATGIARTGIVATLAAPQQRAGAEPRAVIALRADMDALPIQECGGRPHGSREPGRMHACGHDGHTVMLLAAARYLAQHHAGGQGGSYAPPLAVDVRFIFQPAEENAGGARVMLEEGLLDRFPVDRVYGLHNLPGCTIGRILARGGAIAAGFDTFEITVHALGGHAAFAAQGGDAIGAAATMVAQLQATVGRDVSAIESAVLAVTQIHGGSAYNVLPDKVEVAGSVRWFAPAVRDRIRDRIRVLAQGLASAFGVQIDVHYEERYPPVVNDDAAARHAAKAAALAVGPENVLGTFAPIMGSDDFAFLSQRIPGAYVGIGNGVGDGSPLHSPGYDFNDELIVPGALFWIALCQSAAEAP